MLALVERGDAGGMSFGFSVPKGGDEWRGLHRTLLTINLHEISVITSHPAYAATTVEARAASRSLELLRLRLETYRWAGVPMHEIAGWLGHTDAETTRLYAHHHPDYMKAALAAADRRTA